MQAGFISIPIAMISATKSFSVRPSRAQVWPKETRLWTFWLSIPQRQNSSRISSLNTLLPTIPPKLLQIAKRFLETHGDIRAVLDTLFHSPEFWDQQYAGSKFKTPYEYVISAVRASGVSVSNTRPTRGTIGLLGMPVYSCLTPDGYKNTQAAWLNPSAMTQRLNFVTALSTGRLPLNQQQPVNTMEAMDGSKPPEPAAQSNRIKALQASDLITALNPMIS